MKKIVYFTTFLCIFNISAVWGEGLFITGVNKKFKVDQIEKIMKVLLKRDQDNKNIIFYIHGRGKHPNKGVRYLPEIEKRYNANVIMYHWPSWKNAISRPVENAVKSAKHLSTSLGLLNQFKNDNKYDLNNRKFSLMFHSMGNIVFKSFVENFYLGDYSNDFFQSIILNASDIPLKKHSVWLNKVNFSEEIYITFNKNDSILKASKIHDYTRFDLGGTRLGLRLKEFFKQTTLSYRAKYFDLSLVAGIGHRHFLMKETDKLKYTNSILYKILNGDKPDLIGPKIKKKNKYNVYKFLK